MKTIITFVLFISFAVFSWAADSESSRAADWETPEIIDLLLLLPGPGAPVIYENKVIFTAPSDFRRVGVAFAHENFFPIYWFRQLLVPQEQENAPVSRGRRGRTEPTFRDSGIQFHVFQAPEDLRELEYRFIINGLWTIDPHNPITRRDPASGLVWSVVSIPPRPLRPNPLRGLPNGLEFTFRAPPGEVITVAGNFNGWDPFMYELREGPAGVYSITIPLPPGTYQYVFFRRGQRFIDPYNTRRMYSRDGNVVSEIIVP